VYSLPINSRNGALEIPLSSLPTAQHNRPW
jgi:hypothetical protein